MDPLRMVLDAIREAVAELDAKDQVREELLKRSRDAARLIREAIIQAHLDEYDKARELLAEAKRIIDDLVSHASRFPDLVHAGALESLYQEYVEAVAYLSIISEGRIPSYKEVGIPSAAMYLTGLADVVGELRRRVVDELRKGNLARAEELFGFMEAIYTTLAKLSGYPNALTPGLRHKCDVARALVESTRADLLHAKMNSELMVAMRRLLSELRGGGRDEAVRR